MLQVAIQHEPAIDQYTKKYGLDDDFLNPADWKQLRTIMGFLLVFKKATLMT